jgi:hypothetical protein
MSDTGQFLRDVNELLGDSGRFQLDPEHADKPPHCNLTAPLPEISGADSVEVDMNGNVIGGFTQIGSAKLPW